MRSVQAIATLVLLGLVALFAVQNAAVVEIRFLFWGFEMPRVLMIIALLGVGVIVGLALANVAALRRNG